MRPSGKTIQQKEFCEAKKKPQESADMMPTADAAFMMPHITPARSLCLVIRTCSPTEGLIYLIPAL